MNFIYRYIKQRHFWRHANFSEIAELYMSRIFRVLAIYLASGFTAVYLYKLGYSLVFLLACWGVYYLIKVPFALVSAHIAARIGPKHGILISNLIYIPAMIIVGLVPILGEIGIFSWLILVSFSASIYGLCYQIDFSKVKDVKHSGKELAIMNILEKIGISVSPVIGGLVALFFGPEVVMFLSAVVFVIASIPLLKTSEQVHIRVKLNFKSFPWRLTMSSLAARTAVGFDFVTTSLIWGLFIAIAIMPNAGNRIYVNLGVLSSISIIAAIVVSYTFGKLIDKDKGGYLLKYGIIANAFVHAFRSFTNTTVGIVGVNLSNEVATTGYNMAFTRGLFDTADISKKRIEYLCISSMLANLGGMLACLIAGLLVVSLGDINGLRSYFIVAAVGVLFIGTANFRLYRK